jgi:ribonucleoside-diphosphate reductase beta chain
MPLDNDSLPMRLFTASHGRAWSPGDIDFSQERFDWLALTDDERRLLLRLVSGFRVGERGVTHELAPLQLRFRHDGWIEEEIFVAAQMYEEARHVQFFERWLVEALPGRFGVDVPYPELHGDMFSVRLPRAMRALLGDDSPEALLRAVMLYHFYVEGVSAEAGYTVYRTIFERSSRFPGLERGIRLIQRDEARHIAFGVHVLQRLLADHDHLVDLFENQVAALRSFAENDPNEILAGFQPRSTPYRVDHAEYRQRYLDNLEEMRRRVVDRRQ